MSLSPQKMSSHNSKYYVPCLWRNKVKLIDILGLLTKKSKQTDNDNNESEEVGGILFANVLQNRCS